MGRSIISGQQKQYCNYFQESPIIPLEIRMFSSSVAKLTKQLATTHLGSVSSRVAGTVLPAASATFNMGLPSVSCQTFATNRKVIDAKNVKRLKIQAKKKKNVNKPVSVSFFVLLQLFSSPCLLGGTNFLFPIMFDAISSSSPDWIGCRGRLERI